MRRAIGVPLALAMSLVLGAVPIPLIGYGESALDTGFVRIAVLTNGFHSDIAFPADGATLDAFGLDPDDYDVDHERVRYWAVGWGSETAYTSLRAIADLGPSIVAKAISFDRTVMHVAPVGSLDGAEPSDGVRFITLSAESYATLLERVGADFAATEPLPGVTQGFGDRFYRAEGRFTAWFGCNAWVGRRLRDAGVPVGLWTPTAQSLAFGLDRIGGDQS